MGPQADPPMLIGAFHSFLEFIAGVNFAFTGSNKIRNLVWSRLDNLFNRMLNGILGFMKIRADILYDIERTEQMNEQTIVLKLLQNRFDQITGYRNKAAVRCRYYDIKFANLPTKFRSIFLISGIQTLVLMLVSGYEQISGNFLFYGFLIPVSFITIFSLLLFFLNFQPRFDYITTNTTYAFIWALVYTSTLFIIFLQYGGVISDFWGSKVNETWVVTICMITISSSFILFLIHHIVHYAVKFCYLIFIAIKMRMKKNKYDRYIKGLLPLLEDEKVGARRRKLSS